MYILSNRVKRTNPGPGPENRFHSTYHHNETLLKGVYRNVSPCSNKSSAEQSKAGDLTTKATHKMRFVEKNKKYKAILVDDAMIIFVI